MTIRLITGIPGSGKTLYAVSELKKIVEQNAKSDEPRKIYCDITGLKITNIEPPPIDWRTTPTNSLLIYDEAQFHKEFAPSRGVSNSEIVRDLTIHRKTGHEIWLITQDPKRLHNDILAMVEQHHHLERPYGAKLASIYEYRGVERNPSSVSAKNRVENKRLFAYDKSLFDYYESSQVKDGIKMRLPRELTFWLVVLVVITGLNYYYWTADGTQKYLNAMSGKKQESVNAATSEQIIVDNKTKQEKNKEQQHAPSAVPPTAQTAPPPPSVEQLEQGKRVYMYHRQQDLYKKWLPADYEIIKADENLQVRSVIANEKMCRAYNTHGDLMNLSDKECRFYLEEKGRVHKAQNTQTQLATKM